ncbi:MAG: transglycosylase SLT domain-containing protein [Desulfobacterales bacterium]|nr:transglycosylase SLT domain-containing protein [Desulfobacterales bacterium]MDX2512824.1 transglycosylase SLT domain-containing protein [Desulfobacterales bacterium]
MNYYISRCFALIGFFICLVSPLITHAGSNVSAEFPSLISSLKLDAAYAFCSEKVPIKNQEIRERFEKELLLSLWDRPQVILWLKRSYRHLPHIEKVLKENGMPDDLKYIAVAESALRPHVGSKKGAIGFWQFKAVTGRKYGLVINKQVDERRNIFDSTAAAIQYLKHLHQIFKSWTLAAAAYNMGEGGLMAEILEQGTKNYYTLYLPLETQRYLFRILSVKLILSNPEKYGFVLAKKDRYSPLKFDQVQVACSQEIPIRIIAQAGQTHFKMIKDMNPELRGHYLAKGSHTILVPRGASSGFQDRYENFEKKYLASREKMIYIVKEGDNLSIIADRFGIPLAALLIWNRIDIRRPIHPGDRLVINSENVQAE